MEDNKQDLKRFSGKIKIVDNSVFILQKV